MMRVKHKLGSHLVVFNRLLFFLVTVISLSEQSFAMVCHDQIVEAADWTSNVTVQYNTNVTSRENVTYVPMDGSTFPVGRYNITATLNGATECTFLLVVLANPVCPANIPVPSDENLTTTSVIWTYLAENRIDLFPLTSNPVNGSTFDLGVTNVIVYLTDFPEYRCTFEVEVKDEQPPWLTCPSSLDVNNSAVAIWDVPKASDNAGNVLLSSTHRPGSYFPFSIPTEITYTAVDSSGNEVSCSFNLTVIRDGSPEIMNCPSDLRKTVPPGVTSTTVTELWLLEPTATSPSGSMVTVSSDFNRTSEFSVGTTRVTYTFRDQNGASSKCRFFVSITNEPDTEAPVVDNGIECPSSVVRDAPPGTTQMTVMYEEPTFNDLVDGKNITITSTKDSGSLFSAGTTEVLYVATDKSYNINRLCIISVTVNVTEDNENPVIVGCPGNITRFVGPTIPSVEVTWTPPNATDNFEVISFYSSHEPGSMFSPGVTKVNYTATDLVDNQDICVFYVIITVDSERPVIMNCPGDMNEFVAETVSSLEVTWVLPNITDNSGMFIVDSSHQPGETFSAGSVTPVVIDVEDEAGNVAVRCTFTVTVTVDPAPILLCPSMVINDTVLGQSYANISWIDAISVTDTTVFMSNSSHESPLRVELNSPITVTYKVEDLRGNVRSCVLQVVANDTEPPVWDPCPPDVTVPAVPGTNSATVSWTEPDVTDNSGETPIQISTPRASQLFSGGTYTITYIAEDGAGNRGTCSFLVTVTVDSGVPTIENCPPVGHLVFNTPDGEDSARVTWNTITATDTADGSVPVTSNISPGDDLAIGVYNVVYEAKDSSGNMATCLFPVEVRDPFPPVITSCPDNIIAYARPNRLSTPVTWTTEATATDNSGPVNPTSDPSSGSLFNTSQTTTVVYTAIDPSGNVANNPCSFTVTVQTTDLSIRGVVTLDLIRGNGIFLDQQTARQSLQADLETLFRGTSLAPVDFVDVEVTNSVTDSDSNLRASFSLFFAPDSHYNEEEIREVFYNALENQVSFDNGNVIVPDSFDLTVKEFRGEFTLRSILPNIAAVDFTSCCSDPNSQSYQALLQTIYSYFDATFGNLPLFRMSRILPLREGSVIVPYTLTFDGVSPVTLNDIEAAFNATVQESTRELSQTDLFLTLTSDGGVSDTVEICPAGYCSNGGTCNVISRETYAFDCSCQSGYSGTQCENETSQLGTVAIIGIFLGVMGLVLILLVVCCCCLWLMGATSRRPIDEEYLVDEASPPLLLLPMDEEYYRRKPRRQQPIITEMQEEPDPKAFTTPSLPASSGPSFQHEDPFSVPPPQPPPPPPPPPPPQPLILPPPQRRWRPRNPPRQRRERPPSYYETAVAPPPPQYSRQILMLPPPAPRWRRMRDHIERYIPTRGPRFRGNRRPEPLGLLHEVPPTYNDGGPIRRHESGPHFRGDYAPELLPPGGGPIRRNGPRRSDAPRFKGNHVPEEVGDMKRRLFYEFNY